VVKVWRFLFQKIIIPIFQKPAFKLFAQESDMTWNPIRKSDSVLLQCKLIAISKPEEACLMLVFVNSIPEIDYAGKGQPKASLQGIKIGSYTGKTQKIFTQS